MKREKETKRLEKVERSQKTIPLDKKSLNLENPNKGLVKGKKREESFSVTFQI